MDEQQQQQLMTVIQELQQAKLVQLKLIGYLEADLNEKNARIAAMAEQLRSETSNESFAAERNGQEESKAWLKTHER